MVVKKYLKFSNTSFLKKNEFRWICFWLLLKIFPSVSKIIIETMKKFIENDSERIAEEKRKREEMRQEAMKLEKLKNEMAGKIGDIEGIFTCLIRDHFNMTSSWLGRWVVWKCSIPDDNDDK